MPSACGRTGEDGTFEEPVSVPFPLERRQQPILGRLIVTLAAALHLNFGAQMKSKGADHRLGAACFGSGERGGEEPRRRHARAVDKNPDEIAPRHVKPGVDGGNRRDGRIGLPADENVRRKRLEPRRVERRGRSIINENDFVIVRADALLH